MILRAHAIRLMLLALAGVLLLLGVLAATARADEYGGLGGLGVFKAGHDGGHLEVNPRSQAGVSASPPTAALTSPKRSKSRESSYFRDPEAGLAKANTSLKLESS